MRSFLVALLVNLLLPLGNALPGADESDRDKLAQFETKIRPILAAHCYECHSTDAARSGKLKAGLQLDTRTGLLAGGESGDAIVPTDPARSRLLAALKFQGLEMPRGGKLSDAVVADFEKWIVEGAIDPREGQPAKPKEPIDLVKARGFWSLRQVQLPPIPVTLDMRWPAGDVDRFVLAKLEQHRLSPSPGADQAVLFLWFPWT